MVGLYFITMIEEQEVVVEDVVNQWFGSVI